MNLYYTNINRFNEEIEDFVIAKHKIEQPLIESKKIEKKMSITEFIEHINLSNNVYVINDKGNYVIPFEIITPNENDIVIVYSSTCDNDKNEIFKKELEKLKFNLSNLEKMSQFDILNNNIDLSSINYFIINNEFYK